MGDDKFYCAVPDYQNSDGCNRLQTDCGTDQKRCVIDSRSDLQYCYPTCANKRNMKFKARDGLMGGYGLMGARGSI